jgi:hypothetical protein
MGTQTDQLTVSIKQGNRENKLTSFSDNYIYTEAFKNISQSTGGNNTIGNYEYNAENDLATTIFYLSLCNQTNHSLKLYSLFPNSTTILNNINSTKYDLSDYCHNSWVEIVNASGSAAEKAKYRNVFGVWVECVTQSAQAEKNSLKQDESHVAHNVLNWMPSEDRSSRFHPNFILQTGQQFIYFRINIPTTLEKCYDEFGQFQVVRNGLSSYEPKCVLPDPAISAAYLSSGIPWSIGSDVIDVINTSSLDDISRNYRELAPQCCGVKYGTYGVVTGNKEDGYTTVYHHPSWPNQMYVYPKIQNDQSLLIPNSSAGLVLNPNDEILIPIVVEFKCQQQSTEKGNESPGYVQKTISFDIKTSLYKDPINYTATFVAKYEHTDQDKIMIAQQTEYNTNTSKYNVIYK